LYLRLAVVLFVACSWNQLVGQLTPYYIYEFACEPNQNANYLCQDSLYGTGYSAVAAVGVGYCENNRGSTNPLEIQSNANLINCTSYYTMTATAYPTPQANDPYHYAISAGGSSSGCSPSAYGQQACDSQYNYSSGGCHKYPC
jgi:hypothetical protein